MKNILNKIYGGKIHTTKYKEENFKNLNSLESLYGEINEEGINSIVNYLKEKSLFNDINFLDLGCGNGKAVLHMSLYKNVKRSTGVEIYKSKIDEANNIVNLISEDFKNYDKVTFINDDFNNLDNIEDYNLILINNAGIPKEVYGKIFNKMGIGTLILDMFRVTEKIVGSENCGNINISCSWNKNSKITLYKKIK